MKSLLPGIFTFALLLSSAFSTLSAAVETNLIDVMVLYTPAAETAVSRPDNTPILEWIDEAINATNLALSNSESLVRIDLVHKQRINYVEQSNAIDLKNLSEGKNGLGSVKQLKDFYHADVVMLITDNNQGGQAYAIMNLKAESRCNTYAVIKKGSTSVFVHEFGHILGAQHDETLKDGNLEKGIYPYAHGYTGGNWLPNTIVGGYQDVINGIGKINFYSNPLIKYRDAPLGDSGTGDNVRTFNNTAPVIMECENSIITWTGAVNDSWTNSGNWSGNIVPRKFDDVDIPYGLQRYPVIRNGEQYARSLVIDRGATLKIQDGNLYIRSSIFASGDLIAEGGSIQLVGSTDQAIGLTLSNNSRLSTVFIGDGTKMTWVKAGSNLKINGSVEVKENALFDPNGKIINVEGNWKGSGNGVNFAPGNIIVKGTKEVEDVSIKFPFQIDPEGFYGTPKGGFSSLAEFGNYGVQWLIGGNDGQAWLNNENRYPDNAKYLENIDTWLFLPAKALKRGIDYNFSFDGKTKSYGHDFNFSVYYGKTQLPSNMTKAIGEQVSKSNDEWKTFEGKLRVPESGIYFIGIRTTFSNAQYITESYIKNLELNTAISAPDAPIQSCDITLGTIKFTDIMPKNARLYEGERLVSENGRYQLRYNPNETFVVEEIIDPTQCQVKKLWSTRPLNFKITESPTQTYLKFQNDGNVCVVSKLGGAYCITNGRDEFVSLIYNSEKLKLTNDGRLVLLNSSDAETWSSSPAIDDGYTIDKYQTFIVPGDKLGEEESLISANRKYQLRINKKHRLVIEQLDPYSGTIIQEIWSPTFTGGLNNPGNNVFSFNTDCNICFESKLKKYFCITTGRDENVSILYKCEKAVLTDEGNLILYGQNKQELWRSH